MAVLQSQLDITADAVNPVPTLRLAVMNISVVLLSSPAVFLKMCVTRIIMKAIKKPTATTTAYPAPWGKGGSMPPAVARDKSVDIVGTVLGFVVGLVRLFVILPGVFHCREECGSKGRPFVLDQDPEWEFTLTSHVLRFR